MTTGLQHSFDDIRRHVSRFIGAGRSTSDTTSLIDISDIVKSGIIQAYWPVDAAHRWSFLDVQRTLDLVAGQHTYVLPEEFVRLNTFFSYPDGINKSPISTIPDHLIRAWRSTKNETGDPVYCSIANKQPTLGSKSRYEVTFYPTPDAARQLTYSMEHEPQIPTSDYEDKYPLGGAIHSEMILESCLSAAEKILNPEFGPGEHTRRFMELLQSSIEIDKQFMAATSDDSIWPIDAATGGISTLSVTKSQLRRRIGKDLFKSSNPATWTHSQMAEAAECLRDALRMFYQPLVLPGERYSHEWSFLCPVFQLDLVADQYAYTLPADFSLIHGRITYSPTSSILYPPITLVSEEDVRAALQSSATTSRPTKAAIRPKVVNSGLGTRYELLLAPIPNEALQLNFRYAINPEQLGEDQDLPMGGQPHAQTLVEACLAAVESRTGSGNRHYQQFMLSLQSSVSHDRTVSSASTHGISYDTSDGEFDDYVYRDRILAQNGYTTYKGQYQWD